MAARGAGAAASYHAALIDEPPALPQRDTPRARFRTIQVCPKDLRVLPGHPEPAVSWHSGFRGWAHGSTQDDASSSRGAAAWPLAARAQPAPVPLIGFLRSTQDTGFGGRTIGRQILMVDVANERDIHPAFASVVQAGAGGLLIGASPFLLSQRRQLVVLAGRHVLPTVYNQREFVEVGG